MIKSWKTTIAGIAIAGIYALLTSLQGGMNIKDAELAAGIIVLSALMKDFDVTGTGK